VLSIPAAGDPLGRPGTTPVFNGPVTGEVTPVRRETGAGEF